MSQLQDRVHQGFQAGFDEWAAVDSIFPWWFSDSIRQYNEYSPIKMYAVLETVAEQQDYDLPAGAVDVLELDWYPKDELLANKTVTQYEYEAWLAPQPASHIDNLIRDTKSRWWNMDNLGGWYQISATQVRLIPTPSRSGVGIYLTYTIEHTEISGEWPTIPTRHDAAITKLVIANALERRGFGEAGKPDVRQGLTQFVRRHAPSTAHASARRLRADAISKIVQEDQ